MSNPSKAFNFPTGKLLYLPWFAYSLQTHMNRVYAKYYKHIYADIVVIFIQIIIELQLGCPVEQRLYLPVQTCLFLRMNCSDKWYEIIQYFYIAIFDTDQRCIVVDVYMISFSIFIHRKYIITSMKKKVVMIHTIHDSFLQNLFVWILQTHPFLKKIKHNGKV